MKLKRIVLVIPLIISSLFSLEPQKSSEKRNFAFANNKYTKVLRYQDNFIYEDAIQDISTTDNILSNSTIMDNFMIDDNEYKYDCDLYIIKNKILDLAKKYDTNASFTIPNSFEYDDKYKCATTFDSFEALCSSNKSFSNIYSILRSNYEEKIKKENNNDSDQDKSIEKNYDVQIINVLVHGIGGGNHHWSNNGVKEFGLREGTIPYMLKQYYNSDIYLFSINDDGQSSLYDSNKIELSSNYNDFSNGAVILYEDNKNSTGYTDTFYTEFKENINKLMDVYPTAKLNLFGHSRGGNINLLFANEYPLKVNNIYSIATPYYSPVLSNMDEFVQNNAKNSTIINEAKTFIDKTILAHTKAYESLSDETYMKNMRHTWNNLQTKPNLYTLGYNFGFGYSCFVNILWFTIRVDIGIVIPWDVLVGSNNACGLPASTFNLNYLNNNYLITAKSDNSEPLKVKERRLINIPASYIIDIIVNNKNYLKSAPDSPCVPHNLETMYSKTVSKIKDWL